ncbi:MAG: sigma-70 family RNA polymerase sigma factor [Anaerolineales bacterium]|nr:sigma-70 family RNA polymerase sigma factor [Anaerolineales bacterium]
MKGYSSFDEAELTLLVAEGDRQAFLTLYDRFASRVYGLALKMLGDPMLAEEVSQESFMRLWHRAETYRPDRGAFSTWILTITRRVVIDRLRKQSRQPEIAMSIDEHSWHEPPDPDSTSESNRWRTLRFLLDELPEEQREVVELAYFHGLSQRQIAEHTRAPLGTVKTRARLGLEKLRQAWFEGSRSDDE